MKSLYPSLSMAVLLACAVIPARSASASEPGYVDFGRFVPSADGQFVEVNLSEGLLKFGAVVAAAQEPQAAAMLRSLKQVRVNVIQLSDSNRKPTVERVEKIRSALVKDGWMRVVNVREPAKKQTVEIFTKTRGENVIEGLVVTVVDGARQVVLVNVVGDIKPEQIATLAARYNIEPLKQVDWPKTKKS